MNYSGAQHGAMSLAAASSSKYSQEQLEALEACYERNSQPSSQEVKALASETGLTQAQCRAWLQYQRKKRKKSLMEHEREVFRIEIKCLNERIGTVRQQNDKLQRENVTLRRSFEQLKEYEQELGDATTTLESKLDPRFLSRSGSGADDEGDRDRGDHSGGGAMVASGSGSGSGGGPAPMEEGEVSEEAQHQQEQMIEAAVMTLSGVLTKNVENMADQTLRLPSLVQGGRIVLGAEGTSAASTPASAHARGDPADKGDAFKVEASPVGPPLLPHHPQEQQSTSTATTPADSSEAATVAAGLQERAFGRSGSSSLRTEEDVVEGIARNVGKQLSRASDVITRALRNSSRDTFDAAGGGGGESEAVLHHREAVQMRQVLSQKESALSDEIVRSIEEILSAGEQGVGKAAAVAPLLVSYVRTETAIKEQQMLLKSRMLAHLPLVPNQAQAEATQDHNIPVKCTSMLCLFSQCYLGLAERSLCLMGEPSLYALLTHAGQYLAERKKCLSDQDQKQIQTLLRKLKDDEVELVKTMQELLNVSFALVEQHHVPHVSNFLSQCVPKGQTTTLLVSGILTHATQMYIKGLKAAHRTLEPVLCARMFAAMKEVKQLLATADSLLQHTSDIL